MAKKPAAQTLRPIEPDVVVDKAAYDSTLEKIGIGAQHKDGASSQRNRIEQAIAAECVGTVTFDGPAFGGHRVLRCLYSESYSEDR